MHESDKAGRVYDHYHGQAPQSEDVDLLFVESGDRVFRVRQADKWQPFGPPIQAEDCRTVRTDGKDFRVADSKGLIIISKARQLGPAVRSKESAQENQHEWTSAVGRESGLPPLSVPQLEIRRHLVGLSLVRHRLPMSRLFPRSDQTWPWSAFRLQYFADLDDTSKESIARLAPSPGQS